jgi:radical SAM protein with 4Fe4S-binding SPASM domain
MEKETIDLIIKKLSDIFNKGSFSRFNITLTGGDPYLSPYFIYTVKKILDTFKNPSIRADTSVLAPKDLVDKFTDLGGISLVSLNEDPVDEVIEMAKLFKKKKKLIYVNILLTLFNISRLDEVISKALENQLPIRLNHLYNPKDCESFRSKIFDAIIRTGERLCNENYKYYDYFFSMLAIDRKRETFCGYGKNFLVFNADGSVSRCQAELDQPVGNIKDNDLLDLIKTTSELVPYPKECNKCNDLESCWGGCVYANKFGGYCKEYKISLEIMKELKLRRDKDVKTSTI